MSFEKVADVVDDVCAGKRERGKIYPQNHSI
jgi:hypothetical protein